MDFLIFLQCFFAVQSREGEHQVPNCNSRFGFVVITYALRASYAASTARAMFSHLSCTNHMCNWRGNLQSIAKCSRPCFALWFQLIVFFHWMRNLQNWMSPALLRGREPVVKTHLNHWLWKTLLLLEISCWVAMSNGHYPCSRLVLTLTIPFSPLPETTQTPMNPPRRAAQAALLPRLHRHGLRVRSRAAAPAATPAQIADAAPPPPQLQPRPLTPPLLHQASSPWRTSQHGPRVLGNYCLGTRSTCPKTHTLESVRSGATWPSQWSCGTNPTCGSRNCVFGRSRSMCGTPPITAIYTQSRWCNERMGGVLCVFN